VCSSDLDRTAGIAEDITERILTEAAVKENKKKYHNLVETSQCLIWSLDTEGRLIFVNQVAQEFSGYKSEEIIGKNFPNLQHLQLLNKPKKTSKYLNLSIEVSLFFSMKVRVCGKTEHNFG